MDILINTLIDIIQSTAIILLGFSIKKKKVER